MGISGGCAIRRRVIADLIPSRPRVRTMNKGLIWTIVGILLIIALVIWISRAM